MVEVFGASVTRLAIDGAVGRMVEDGTFEPYIGNIGWQNACHFRCGAALDDVTLLASRLAPNIALGLLNFTLNQVADFRRCCFRQFAWQRPQRHERLKGFLVSFEKLGREMVLQILIDLGRLQAVRQRLALRLNG